MSFTARLSAALVLAGALFDSPSLYVPGVALALLCLGAWGWVDLAAREATIERLPVPARVVEGEVHRLKFRFARGRAPLPGGELLDPALDAVMPIGANPPGSLELSATFVRRGPLRLAPPRLRLRDPLGLRSTEVEGAGEAELLVLPRIEPVRWSAGRGGSYTVGGREWEAEGGRLELHSPELEIDGLRPYRAGSPASRIHWPTVARSGELIERRMVSDDRGTLIVLDAAGRPDRDDLDRVVRAAASLCVDLARRGGCSLLLPGDPQPIRIDGELRTWPQAHARLAVVGPGRSAVMPRRDPRAAITIWIGASIPRREAIASSGYVVTPWPLQGLAVAFSVAGCSGHRGRRAAAAGGVASAAEVA